MNKKLKQLSLSLSAILLLTACGGGGATTTKYNEDNDSSTNREIVGRVINGYIENSTVFFDLDGNLEYDEGEPKTTTDKYGRYKLVLTEEQFDKKIDRKHSIVAQGGTNTFTNKEFTTKLMATPEFSTKTKPIYITPISTFRTALFMHAATSNFGIGFISIDNEVKETILKIDASKYVDYVKDNNLEYYKASQVLQKAIELSGDSYAELTLKLKKSTGEKTKSLDDLINELSNSDKIKKVKAFYYSLNKEQIKDKKVSISKAVQKKIDNNEDDFNNIDISSLKKDDFKNVPDFVLDKIVIDDGVKKEGTLLTSYNNQATIFLDENKNFKLDTNEPKTITDENGNFQIEVEKESISKRRSLVAINGKNKKGEVSSDILFTTIMMEGKDTINTFTSIQTALAFALGDKITPSTIFHSNFVESMFKSFEIDADNLKSSENDNLELYRKALKVKAFVKALANTYGNEQTEEENIFTAYKHFSSNIVEPAKIEEHGFDKIIERFNKNNPMENESGEKFSDLLSKISQKYDNATKDTIESQTLKNEVQVLIEKAKEFKSKSKPKAVSLEFNLNSDVAMPKDQFSKYQWHLNDTGSIINTNGIYSTGKGDLGVKALYEKKIVGKGVHVRVVDDGVEASHEDLKGRINLEDSKNAETKQNDPTSPKIEDTHGTQVAGLIAADGSNDIGVRGVAPYATLSAYKLRTPKKGALDYTFEELTEAWLGGSDEISIVNNSWGATIDKYIEEEKLLEKGASTKRVKDRGNGEEALGRIYLIAAGNGGFNQGNVEDVVDDAVTSYFRGSQYAITVAAVRNENIVTQYSAQGSNVLVSGYGGGVKTKTSALMTTTTRTGVSTSTWEEDTKKAYSFAFDGTSAATPVTSGALALVMGKCPNLSYRDVKWLIAHTAKKIDENYDGVTISGVPNVPPFKTTPEKDLYQGFGYVENAAGLSHSNYYGYGLINPSAMIEKCTASDFTYLPAKKTIKVSNDNTSLKNLSESNQRLEEKIRINKSEVEEDKQLDKIEWVGLTLYSDIKNLQKISMVLISPSGTKSRILTNSKTALSTVAKLEYGYRFSSVAFVDENPYGEWTLLVQSDDENEEGRFFKMELEVVGYKNSERK